VKDALERLALALLSVAFIEVGTEELLHGASLLWAAPTFCLGGFAWWAGWLHPVGAGDEP